ncbi:MAG: LPS export ABC transporter ATP-binding protein [Kiritimatiellae bacterium]|nr:LPS export ABC transporter ATP-binding protein [Kiritimatiellia bacterium]
MADEETVEKTVAETGGTAAGTTLATTAAEEPRQPTPDHPADIQAEGLVKQYGQRTVVNGISLHANCGEVVGLLGPNGAGKTTTFYMIVGLVRPNLGTVSFRGSDITRMPVYKRARLGLGYLAQEASVFRKLTVEENVMAILETLHLGRQERRERMSQLLEELNLTKVAKQRAYTLSGGERRKLEIARALVRRPAILMLDEPFSGVDPLAVHDIQEIVLGLKRKGLGIIVTDHNVRETLSIVDRAYLVYDGQILREGTSRFLVEDPEARRLYLGQDFRM